MPSPSKPPPLAEAVRGSLAYAARAREHLRAGLSDARIASLEPPPAEQHARRFFFGFALPLTLMRIAWSNAEIKASIVRRLIPPLLFVGLATAIGVADIVRSVVANRNDTRTLALEIASDEKDDKEYDYDSDEEDAKHAQAKAAGAAIAQAAKDAKGKGGSAFDISAAAIEAVKEQGDAAQARADAAKAKGAIAKSKAAEALARPPTGHGALRIVWDFLTSKVAKLIATLSAIEWILVWIGREHHDQISYETAVLTGVPGERLAAPPRLRFDFGWLKLKGWRALRLLFFFSLALPLAWLVGLIPRAGESLALVLEGLWAAYWACVFAIGNSFLVWEAPVGDAAPWFVRALRSVGRIPIVGLPFRLYTRLVTRVTRNVWPACLAFEKTTWESAGLALARTIASAPVLYMIMRPAFSTAATHAWVARTPQPESEVVSEPASPA